MAIFLKLLGNGRDGDQISISPAAEVFMCHQMGHMASRRLKTALAMNDVLWQNLYSNISCHCCRVFVIPDKLQTKVFIESLIVYFYFMATVLNKLQRDEYSQL